MTRNAPLPVPQVHITPDDAHELRTLSAELECETLRAYEEFALRDRHRIDDNRWRHVRSHEDLRVYRERSSFKATHAHAGIARVLQHTVYQHLEIGPQAALSTRSKMPIMLCVGTIGGTLDDKLYASTMHDSASLRTRNQYMKDAYEDNVVLSVLDEATPEEPFRFLGLVWYLKQFNLPMIISDRDLFLLAATRFGQLSTGERVGVNLYHSVEHRDVPAFKDRGILRMEMTLGVVTRQLPGQRVEVFMMGFVEPHGSTPEMFGVQDAAKILLHASRSPEIAFRKKLHWRMREMQKNGHPNCLTSSGGTDNRGKCSLCTKSLGGLFLASGVMCQICSNRVCSKCSIKRQIIVESTRLDTTFHPFDFCMRCTLETKELSTSTVARHEVYERAAAKARKLDSTHSSSSSSTRSI